MHTQRWTPLALLIIAALLSSLLAPALSAGWRDAKELLSAVLAQPGAALAAGPDGRSVVREAGSPAALEAVVQAAITLPLWEEEIYPAYLPFVRR
jgi:hypothetical protein